jgi:ribosomal protein L7/L12
MKTYTVFLCACPFNVKIPMIALVRKRTGMGLAQAKDAVENAAWWDPLKLSSGLTQDEATMLRTQIEEMGGESLTTPFNPREKDDGGS